jgi:predicted transposase/invertase (TIGR01784 family)
MKEEEKAISPHDKYFRQVMTHLENAQSFFQCYLPETVKLAIDLGSLSIEKDSFVEKELRASYSDLLYRTKIQEKEGFIYLLFEHQSSPEPLISL